MRWLVAIFILILNSYLLVAGLGITGLDTLTAGETGGGGLSVGGGSGSSTLTGIPPTVEVPSGGVSSGPTISGGSGLSLFDLDKTFFSLEIKKGLDYQEKITITNNINSNLTINIFVDLSKKFIFPEEETFVLGPKETKEILFNIYVSDKEESDVYIGKIYFDALGRKKSVDFVLDVGDKLPLFDIKTTILNKYVFPGWKVVADLLVLNLGDLKNIDVELEYFIRDFENNTYTSKKESFAINESFEGEIFLEAPENLKEGNYIFFSKVSYGDISANSYDTFFVKSGAYLAWAITIFINLFLIILTAGMIVYLIKSKDQEMKNYQHVSSYG